MTYLQLPVISYLHFGVIKNQGVSPQSVLKVDSPMIQRSCIPPTWFFPPKTCKDHGEFRRAGLHRHCPDTQTGVELPGLLGTARSLYGSSLAASQLDKKNTQLMDDCKNYHWMGFSGEIYRKPWEITLAIKYEGFL